MLLETKARKHAMKQGRSEGVLRGTDGLEARHSVMCDLGKSLPCWVPQSLCFRIWLQRVVEGCLCGQVECAEFYTIGVLMPGQGHLTKEGAEVPAELLGCTKGCDSPFSSLTDVSVRSC